VNLYRVLPPPPQAFDLGDESDLALITSDLAPPATAWVRAVLVTNALGDTEGLDGTSGSLTSGVDRKLLGLQRAAFDVIVMGATTARRERIPVPQTTPLAVVTTSGDLSGHQLLVTPGSQLVVVTRPGAAATVQETLGDITAEIITIDGEGFIPATEVRNALRERLGAKTFLLEGGRSIWESWVDLIDEVALSVAPPPNDHHRGIPSWWPLDTSSWQLTSLMTDDAKMLYHRYQTGIRGAPSGLRDSSALR
jgi:riboflavin biosynthesis pyrimidine reductase